MLTRRDFAGVVRVRFVDLQDSWRTTLPRASAHDVNHNPLLTMRCT